MTEAATSVIPDGSCWLTSAGDGSCGAALRFELVDGIDMLILLAIITTELRFFT